MLLHLLPLTTVTLRVLAVSSTFVLLKSGSGPIAREFRVCANFKSTFIGQSGREGEKRENIELPALVL